MFYLTCNRGQHVYNMLKFSARFLQHFYFNATTAKSATVIYEQQHFISDREASNGHTTLQSIPVNHVTSVIKMRIILAICTVVSHSTF